MPSSTISHHDVNAVYCLRFNDVTTSSQRVECGPMWRINAATDLGTAFYWEALVRKTNLNTGYIISDGFGGGHALLWGHSTNASGNLWTSAGSALSFNGTYNMGLLEWCYVAVALHNGYLYTYVNGIADGLTSMGGTTRRCFTNDGTLFIGGSDHINFLGDIVYVRGWDRGNTSLFGAGNADGVQVPPRGFVRYNQDLPPDFVMLFDTPGMLVDASPRGVEGVDGQGRIFHHGRLGNASTSGSSEGALFPPARRQIETLPIWVRASGCPWRQPLGVGTPNEPARTPVTMGGTTCLARDSFGRANQTWAYQNPPTLGSTEGGSLGALPWAWKSGTVGNGIPSTWGILGTSAISLHAQKSPATLQLGTANVDLRVARDVATGASKRTGLAFRIQDDDNFWNAWVDGTSLHVHKVTAGSEGTALGSYTISATDRNLRVLCNGTSLTFYTGNGNTWDPTGWTQVGQLAGQTGYQAATKHGLGGRVEATNSTLARYRNFIAIAV
jgi:hypothetical protein